MLSLAGHIEECLGQLGSDAFAVAYLEFIETLDVDQIMVFSIKDDHARCLVSRHFTRSAIAGRLAGNYLDGWFRHDPLLDALHDIPVGEVGLRRVDAATDPMRDDYRKMFFQDPGLSGKTTLMAAGRNARLFVNLYQGGPDAPPLDPDIARLAGRLVLMHFDRPTSSDMPPPLSALSERERDVCLGILAGKKAETIAGDLDIAASTVITYRKRAYEKLGVNTRAGLFAICRS